MGDRRIGQCQQGANEPAEGKLTSRRWDFGVGCGWIDRRAKNPQTNGDFHAVRDTKMKKWFCVCSVFASCAALYSSVFGPVRHSRNEFISSIRCP
ncbi:hypothetical protein V2G26_008548 [Clonostachys chloroleuca]